jgi:hypothetical protein
LGWRCSWTFSPQTTTRSEDMGAQYMRPVSVYKLDSMQLYCFNVA